MPCADASMHRLCCSWLGHSPALLGDFQAEPAKLTAFRARTPSSEEPANRPNVVHIPPYVPHVALLIATNAARPCGGQRENR